MASILGQPVTALGQAVAGLSTVSDAVSSGNGTVEHEASASSSSTIPSALTLGGLIGHGVGADILGVGGSGAVGGGGASGGVVHPADGGGPGAAFYTAPGYDPSAPGGLADDAGAFIAGANPQSIGDVESGTTNAYATNSGPIPFGPANESETASVVPTFSTFAGSYDTTTGTVSGGGIENVAVTMGHTAIDSINYNFPGPTVVPWEYNGFESSRATSNSTDWDPSDSPPVPMFIVNPSGGNLGGSVSVLFSYNASAPDPTIGYTWNLDATITVGTSWLAFYTTGGTTVYAGGVINGVSVPTTTVPSDGSGYSATIPLPTDVNEVPASIGWESRVISGPGGVYNGSGSDTQLVTLAWNLGMTIGN